MNRIDFLVKNAEGRVLNVGCCGDSESSQRSAWTLMERLQRRVLSVRGIDINTTAIKAMATRYDVDSVDARFIGGRKWVFDTVVAGDILEHLDEPGMFLRGARKIAKKLVLTVPNSYAWGAMLTHGILGQKDPHAGHMMSFSKDTLPQMIEACGWSVEAVFNLQTEHQRKYSAIKDYFEKKFPHMRPILGIVAR